MVLIETERLKLRELTLDDAAFIQGIVNEPSWLENIGDRNVHSIADAERYLREGPVKSYQEHGFGLYLVELKLKKIPIGMCGLVKREDLDFPDIGYALLPEYWGAGLASEAAAATLEYARNELGLSEILGITSLENASSIRVLEKIGMRYDKEIMLPGYDGPSRLFVLK
ncbi:GNAT family N-acetyltransferase [Aliikangiella sp. G2MR2-5]|uniref:GNAT family N-acetyltransferase n=1 Tax=Aliikangiella sp. G2MR2-5 TaxID=2788943 RepID=UPI0018A937F9|nr:GNAT family N-acetyltransferase [Aliikangiella sp. G2MR2-5]